MKKILTLIIALICGINLTYSQNGWHQLSTTGSTLKSVWFVSQNIGYVADQDGSVYRTYDGGDTWTLKNSGISSTIFAIFFIDENNGWAVGGNATQGTIFRTTNAGESWTAGTCSAAFQVFKSVYFTDYNNGFTVGTEGSLYRTTDGGANWGAYNSGTTEYLSDVFFTNANNGYAVGDFGTLSRTTNGGNDWSINSTIPYGMFSDIWFADENTGYVVDGGGGVQKTTDGGSTWNSLTISGNHDFRSVCFRDAQIGFTVGTFGEILKTSDGGQNWYATASGTTNDLNSVFFINSNLGFAVGDGGTILKTTSCGENPYLYVSSNSINLSGTYNVSEFDIDANTTWSVVEDASWITLYNTSGTNSSTVNFSVDENTTGYSREASIVVYGGYVDYQTVTIYQDAGSDITTLEVESNLFYPNPADGMLIFIEKGNYEIFNCAGVKIITVENSQNADISEFKSGIYFVKSEEGKIQKLIKN